MIQSGLSSSGRPRPWLGRNSPSRLSSRRCTLRANTLDEVVVTTRTDAAMASRIGPSDATHSMEGFKKRAVSCVHPVQTGRLGVDPSPIPAAKAMSFHLLLICLDWSLASVQAHNPKVVG